ncbi:hypothetical protein Tco_0142673, partial [Tanacetum coccineum]
DCWARNAARWGMVDNGLYIRKLGLVRLLSCSAIRACWAGKSGVLDCKFAIRDNELGQVYIIGPDVRQ